MNAAELACYLDAYLNIARVPDKSNNGLQVQGPDEVTRVTFAVDACLASFKAALTQKAQLLIVHHGLFWGEPLQITGLHFERVKTLIDGGCGLYASHVPLDAHPEVGNNVELARLIGLTDVQPWGDYKGIKIGVIGNLPEPMPLAALNELLEAAIGKGNRVQGATDGHGGPGAPAGVAHATRVAICSGFGVTLLDDAIAAGADTLLTGETSHQWFHPVEETNLNVIFGGHYNTETVGLKALARHLEAKFGLETRFIDLPTGL